MFSTQTFIKIALDVKYLFSCDFRVGIILLNDFSLETNEASKSSDLLTPLNFQKQSIVLKTDERSKIKHKFCNFISLGLANYNANIKANFKLAQTCLLAEQCIFCQLNQCAEASRSKNVN